MELSANVSGKTLLVSPPHPVLRFSNLKTGRLAHQNGLFPPLMLGDSQVDDLTAHLIITQLPFLDAEDPKDIKLFINSPGGSVTAGPLVKIYLDFMPYSY
ncbi:ATP-dependent Clp protease proteolytic subunit [Nymphaea thermarum]|nr:ATP-dependent Clp protease proteolytic subunit [Nymphaea thermarum]